MDEKQNDNIDRAKLINAFKTMGVCILLMFVGPTLIHLSLSNDNKPYYILLLVISILVCVAAIILFFIGLNRIMNTFFKRKK